MKIKLLSPRLTLQTLLSCLLVTSFSLLAEVKVTLVNQGIELNYSSNVRFSHVLNDVQPYLTSQEYYLASKIFRANKPDYQVSVQNNIEETLSILSTKHPEKKELYKKMYQQIKPLMIGDRVASLTPDIDIVRVTPESNPILQGDFELFLSPRPNHITVFGVIKNVTRLMHYPQNSVSSYLDETPLLDAANNSFATIVMPNGDIHKTGFAYWNQQSTPLPPGAIIYLGLSRPDELEEKFEQQIISFLTSVKG